MFVLFKKEKHVQVDYLPIINRHKVIKMINKKKSTENQLK